MRCVSRCPSLTSLSCDRMGQEMGNLFTPSDAAWLQISSKWKASLDTLICASGSTHLQSLDSLLPVLQKVRNVKINSGEITSEWAGSLLSSAPSLVSVVIPRVVGLQRKWYPSFSLPKLRMLRLGALPRTNAPAANGFFGALEAPKLSALHLGQLSLADLSGTRSSLPVHTSIIDTCNFSSLKPKVSESAASTLISWIKGCKNLSTFNLNLPDSTPSGFWDHLVSLLTPLSREAIQADWKEETAPRSQASLSRNRQQHSV